MLDIFNDMYAGRVPPELKDINLVEEMLIALAFPFMRIYRRTPTRYSYSLHVINIAQNLTNFELTLPPPLSDLDV